LFFALAIALVLALVAVLWRMDEASEPAKPEEPTTSSVEARAPLDAPSIEPMAVRETTAEPTAERTETPASAAAPAERRVILSGVVYDAMAPLAGSEVIVMRGARNADAPLSSKGTSDGGMAATSVRRLGRDEPKRNYAFGVATQTRDSGSYRVDVSRFFPASAAQDRDQQTDTLWVKVTRVGAAPVEFDVALLHADDIARATGVVQLEADLGVTAICTATGVARAADGAVDQVMVFVFELVDGKPGASPTFQYAAQSPAGHFGLPLDCEREYVVVAASEGYAPETRIVSPGSSRDLGELVLHRGASIAGFARVAGAPVRGVVKLELDAPESRELVPRSSIGSHWLAWFGGRFEWDSLTVSSGDDGAFAASGLRESDYRVSLRSSRGVFSSRTPSIVVRAPAGGVDLSPSVCRLDLRLFHLGQPAANTAFEITEAGGGATTISSYRADATGAAVLWIDPELETTIAVTQQGAEGEAPVRTALRAYCPGPGQSTSMRLDF